MRATVAVVLAAFALALLPADALRADNIIRTRGSIDGVEVYMETYKVVEYFPPGVRIKQTVDQKDVIRVEYAEFPEAYKLAQEDLNNSQFQNALDGFLEASRENADDFPHAKQYGLFWAAETLRKWAEAGNGSAIPEAIKTYDALLAAMPETVHLAKVHIGRGRCLLMMGNKDAAMKEFKEVPSNEYFKAEDKVAARVAMAYVLELEGKFSNALNEYMGIEKDAQKVAPDTLPIVKVRIATCKVGLERYTEALDDFDRLLSSAERPEVRAAAYNGRGDCYWKKREYEKGMWDYLKVLVLYETVTSESPKAYYYAAQCMTNMAAELGKKNDKEGQRLWRSRARDLIGELKEKFPGSEYANK